MCLKHEDQDGRTLALEFGVALLQERQDLSTFIVSMSPSMK